MFSLWNFKQYGKSRCSPHFATPPTPALPRPRKKLTVGFCSVRLPSHTCVWLHKHLNTNRVTRHILFYNALLTFDNAPGNSHGASVHIPICFLFFSVIFREGKGERETAMCERNISVWHTLLHTPTWGPGPQPRHVPWPRIEPATLLFAGQCSIHWATPARADLLFKLLHCIP